MIYSVPQIGSAIGDQLQELDALRRELSIRVDRAVPWSGSLRRFEKGSAWGSSVGIEGFEVTNERAIELASGLGDAPRNEDEQALACYAQAMDHVATLAEDDQFDWSTRVILDLHFEACRFQTDKRPGLLRKGQIKVTGPSGGSAFEAPPAEQVPGLCRELSVSLTDSGAVHPVVAAALAHLNLVSIHPFEDGNGRISRIIQSLVLARQRILAPEFGSIESCLADDTGAYYAALQSVQRGTYSPTNDPTPWIEFCVKAHLEQAEARGKVIEIAANRWTKLEGIVSRRGWDDRLVIALEQALTGGTSRARYTEEAAVSNPTASNDLRRLVDAGYLNRVSQGRTASYKSSERLETEAKP